MASRKHAVDHPAPAFPDRWQGGSKSFGIIGQFNGHRAMARYRTDTWGDGDWEERRNSCEGYDADEEYDGGEY